MKDTKEEEEPACIPGVSPLIYGSALKVLRLASGDVRV